MPRRTDPLLAALMALAPCAVAAQAPTCPTAQDIDRALKANPFPERDRIGAQPPIAVPNIAPQPAALDIEALLRGRHSPAHAVSAGIRPPPLRIFITLGMPHASLQLLTEQASRTGAVLVLRGLKSQSMRETLSTVSELIGTRKVAWVIDPEAFTRYGIDQAPTFVLDMHGASVPDPQPCVDRCPGPAAFVSVAGDVSLDYALQTMVRQRPQSAPWVEPMLKRLRSTP